MFTGYEQISEKIAGFHRNWPGCRLVLAAGVNIFLNSARIGGVIVGPDDAVRARATRSSSWQGTTASTASSHSGTPFSRFRLLGRATLQHRPPTWP